MTPTAAGELLLPPRDVVPKPNAEDPVDYYYKPVTGRLYRARLRLALELLGGRRYRALLEIGYGSGIFLPELARHADRVAAIDVHEEREAVAHMLARLAVTAELREASLYELPYRDDEFDALVCVSVLEHLRDLDAALDEFRRVLAPGGIAVLGFPVRNPITDAFFRLAGYDPREIHPSSHLDVLRAAIRHRGLRLERKGRVPRVLPLPLAAYAACRCRAV